MYKTQARWAYKIGMSNSTAGILLKVWQTKCPHHKLLRIKAEKQKQPLQEPEESYFSIANHLPVLSRPSATIAHKTGSAHVSHYSLIENANTNYYQNLRSGFKSTSSTKYSPPPTKNSFIQETVSFSDPKKVP